MEESKIKHLEFIQNSITRMNTNSFQIKGMEVTIAATFLAIFASTSNVVFIFLGIVPTLLFWFLDSYYLLQERKFRGVYDDVIGLKNRIEVRPFDMPIWEYTKKKDIKFSFWKVFLSPTVYWLYFSIIFLLVVIGLFVMYKDCSTVLK